MENYKNQSLDNKVLSWSQIMPNKYENTVNQDTGPATCRGSFLGQNISDPAAEGEFIFTDPTNLPTAIATILNHAQNRANFHPATQAPELLSASLNEYVDELKQIPFFKDDSHDIVVRDFNSNDYNILIDQILSLYGEFSKKTKEEMKGVISNIGKSVFGGTGGNAWVNLFASATINYETPSNPILLVYMASFNMLKGRDGKNDIYRQHYEVKRNIYNISHDIIKSYASELSKLTKTSVDDWLTGVTSMEEKGKNLCFDLKPFAEN